MDIEQIIKRVKDSGSHFFDRDTMRFFRSRVCPEVEALPNQRALFITSEQFQFHQRRDPRCYTIRFLSSDRRRGFNISEVGGFQYFASKRQAVRAMGKFAAWLREGYRELDDPDCCAD